MRSSNFTRDGQAESRTPALRGTSTVFAIEFLENGLQVLGADFAALVFHLNHKKRAFCAPITADIGRQRLLATSAHHDSRPPPSA